jgi:myo-inositol-1-phosphate synthase
VITKAPGPTADIAGILKDTGTDVVVSFLPVGSEMAAKWYVEQVLDAGCGCRTFSLFHEIATCPVYRRRSAEETRDLYQRCGHG